MEISNCIDKLLKIKFSAVAKLDSEIVSPLSLARRYRAYYDRENHFPGA